MKIEITTQRAFAERAFKSPPPNLIFITGPQNPFQVERTREAVEKVPNKLVLLFDDLWKLDGDPNIPTKKHVIEAIEFAKDLDELVVCCRMGVSRSAAIAFGIAASRVGMADAFNTLNHDSHSPNPLIIRYIQEVLNLPCLTDAMEAWKKGDQKNFEYCLAAHSDALKRREQMERESS